MNGVTAIEAHDSSCPANEAWLIVKDGKTEVSTTDVKVSDILAIIAYAVLFVSSIVAVIYFCLK